MQVLGKKRWKVYKKVPVEFPFEKEQVGKCGRPVDSSVFEGGLCFRDKDVVLCPGDVLYLPRGFVHEATTELDSDASGCEPSFHITLAIATHDWCLSVMLSEAVRQTLDNVTRFREALPIGPCDEYERSSGGESASAMGSTELKQQLDEAMAMIQSKVTPMLLERNLRQKYSVHNEHARGHRLSIQYQYQQSKKRKCMHESDDCVGHKAAAGVTLRTILRVSTPEERNSVPMEEGRLRGLTVREETMPVLMKILGELKGDQSLRIAVRYLRDLVDTEEDEDGSTMVCDFTILSFARCCVELGALAVAGNY